MSVPQSYYYYCPLGDAERRSWFRTLLARNQIWFRDPNTLNDINELKPKLVFEGSNNELRRFGHDAFLRHSPTLLSPARRIREVGRYVYQLIHYPKQYERLLHDILARVGILSLSAVSSEHLLWAHYADGHRGACVEFDSSQGLFFEAQPVMYVDEAPTINRVKDSMDAILNKSMFTKHTRWRHEQEWRVIALWDDERRKATYLAQHNVSEQLRPFIETQHGGGYYSVAKTSIKKVILGAKASVDVEQWLVTALRENDYAPPLVRAQVGADGAIIIP